MLFYTGMYNINAQSKVFILNEIIFQELGKFRKGFFAYLLHIRC